MDSVITRMNAVKDTWWMSKTVELDPTSDLWQIVTSQINIDGTVATTLYEQTRVLEDVIQ